MVALIGELVAGGAEAARARAVTLHLRVPVAPACDLRTRRIHVLINTHHIDERCALEAQPRAIPGRVEARDVGGRQPMVYIPRVDCARWIVSTAYVEVYSCPTLCVPFAQLAGSDTVAGRKLCVKQIARGCVGQALAWMQRTQAVIAADQRSCRAEDHARPRLSGAASRCGGRESDCESETNPSLGNTSF